LSSPSEGWRVAGGGPEGSTESTGHSLEAAGERRRVGFGSTSPRRVVSPLGSASTTSQQQTLSKLSHTVRTPSLHVLLSLLRVLVLSSSTLADLFIDPLPPPSLFSSSLPCSAVPSSIIIMARGITSKRAYARTKAQKENEAIFGSPTAGGRSPSSSLSTHSQELADLFPRLQTSVAPLSPKPASARRRPSSPSLPTKKAVPTPTSTWARETTPEVLPSPVRPRLPFVSPAFPCPSFERSLTFPPLSSPTSSPFPTPRCPSQTRLKESKLNLAALRSYIRLLLSRSMSRGQVSSVSLMRSSRPIKILPGTRETSLTEESTLTRRLPWLRASSALKSAWRSRRSRSSPRRVRRSKAARTASFSFPTSSSRRRALRRGRRRRGRVQISWSPSLFSFFPRRLFSFSSLSVHSLRQEARGHFRTL
jgi:hypothetical protein